MAAPATEPTVDPDEAGGRSGAFPRWPIALVVVTAALVGALVIGRSLRDDDLGCDALLARVESLGGFDWDNGITSSGAEWVSVLTGGAIDADRASRDAIARAVRADASGFERFRAALPDDLEPAADRLHALALDPDESYRRRSDAAVARDAEAVTGHAVAACGIAP